MNTLRRSVEKEIEGYLPTHEDPNKQRTPMADLFEILWNAVLENESISDEVKETLKPILLEHVECVKEGLMRNFIRIGHFMSLIGSSDLPPCRTAVWQLGSLIEDLSPPFVKPALSLGPLVLMMSPLRK